MNSISHASLPPDGAVASHPDEARPGEARPGEARPGEARPGEARHDLHQRDVVDDALALMQAVGTLSALEYLKSHAVEGRIIARVLLEPRKRRSQPGLVAA
ncbi:hypothetical protein [Massilia sp. H6]|uniref:hypothetical protein n=1 Tax=Massilia sp. H6 TaxID=2970464 RepID=UPI002168B51A|nr:hypothetical protein [Massilia sp. H6]UVW27367.1 hypothetical protein NRS07_12435 [Massilia sp. H6]